MEPSSNIARLIDIMARLRDPEGGCPWDIEQNFASIAPYTIEEAYEVADAIARADMDDLCEELGDLLLQVVYHAQIADEQGMFSFGDVVLAITRKLIRRHPHVFGDADARSAGAVKGLWEGIKAQERADKGAVASSALDGVPLPLPALTRAEKIQKKAAKVGFDWDNPGDVLAKLREEIAEIEQEAETGDKARLREEFGDLLFAAVNAARHFDIDPEDALRAGNDKFVRRFKAMERRLAEDGTPVGQAGLERMERGWQDVKREDG